MSNDLRKTLSIDFESKLHFTEIPSPNFLQPESDFLFDIISSCRGFIFLHHSSKFQLWNPSTGAFRQIPLSPNELNEDNLCYLYGFGYDQLKDDYLVVSVSINDFDDGYSSLEFFSLKDNMWREIEGSRFPYTQSTWIDDLPRVGSLFNGNIHWLAENIESWDNVILAFDITERKLVEMPYPDGIECEIERDEDCDLCVFGEFLSLWAIDYHNSRVEIWVMREYKVHSSWTKILFLPINDISIEYVSLICSTKSGNIVVADDTELAMYNNKGQLLEYKSYHEGPVKQSGNQVTAYTESLLSLPSNNVKALEDDTNKKNEVLKYFHAPFSCSA
jgi:F-box interacting protein